METLNSLDLGKSYQQLAQYLESLEKSDYRISSNKSLLILNKKCVRIYLVAEAISRCISLQVEVFPLLNTQVHHSSNSSSYLHNILDSYISNLQYIMNLGNSGFELRFIEKEGIWFVKKTIRRDPDDEFCKLILPP